MDGMLEVLRLINALREVKGRKKLQKIVHILQSRGYNFPHYFGYLHYGPYSSSLAAEVNALVSCNLVSENGTGEEYEPFIYKPEETARVLLQDLNITGKPPWLPLARYLNAKDANYLEAMSTVLYLKSNNFTGKALKERFSKLKPNLKRYYEDALKEAASLPK
ncbi:MAG TPA: hypothetical protein VMG59_12325 [Phycisphaerae bacterium]|nr:hypothetical protein [Phycisphaerae bacterium]